MTRNEIAAMLDHSVLKPEADANAIRDGAAVVREWRVGFYCVQPFWVRAAVESLQGTDARVISVVGFPHGLECADIKASAALRAVADGAREIDTVINLGALRSGDVAAVAHDLATIISAVPGIPVKVILETAALTDDEKRLACRLAVEAGAAFVKTSTGFHAAGGATAADVALMRAAVPAAMGVKASGGIRTLTDVEVMFAAGATRIGTSASASILAAVDGRA